MKLTLLSSYRNNCRENRDLRAQVRSAHQEQQQQEGKKGGGSAAAAGNGSAAAAAEEIRALKREKEKVCVWMMDDGRPCMPPLV